MREGQSPGRRRGVRKPRLRDDAARLALWHEHRGVAIAAASRRLRRARYLCRDDLYQAADIALWDATGLWDEAGGSSFRAFAYKAAYFATLAEMLANSTWGAKASRVSFKQRFFLPSAVGRAWTGQDTLNGDDEPAHPYACPADRLAAKEIAGRLMEALGPGIHADVARLCCLEGRNQTEAGKLLGLDGAEVKAIRTDAIRRLRNIAREMGFYDE